MNFHLGEDAILEVENAISYSFKNFGLGDEMNMAIREAIGLIMTDPFRFALRRDGFRSYKLPGYPFRLFFEAPPDSETVFFYAFSHTSRRPNYWKQGIPES